MKKDLPGLWDERPKFPEIFNSVKFTHFLVTSTIVFFLYIINIIEEYNLKMIE
jgi:hypothetical protein